MTNDDAKIGHDTCPVCFEEVPFGEECPKGPHPRRPRVLGALAVERVQIRHPNVLEVAGGVERDVVRAASTMQVKAINDGLAKLLLDAAEPAVDAAKPAEWPAFAWVVGPRVEHVHGVVHRDLHPTPAAWVRSTFDVSVGRRAPPDATIVYSIPPCSREVLAACVDSLPQRVATAEIDAIGGNCPVQADVFVECEGEDRPRYAYFRARASRWSLELFAVGSKPDQPDGLPAGKPEWHVTVPWGTSPDAGWMGLGDAEELVRWAIVGVWSRGYPAGLDAELLPVPPSTGPRERSS